MSTDDETQGPATPGSGGTCTACRGTGQLTSGLGGTPHQVTCPWCQGTGRRIPGIDAQAHPAESEAGAQDSPST
jgi:DnaJ-class molecular chaperone